MLFICIYFSHWREPLHNMIDKFDFLDSFTPLSEIFGIFSFFNVRTFQSCIIPKLSITNKKILEA